jgi:nickel/cobalt transporter (NicO) family protein
MFRRMPTYVTSPSRKWIAIFLTIVVMPLPAFAHPMGNFSINHYTKIQAGESAIDLEYIIDMAEIPTFQEIQEKGLVPQRSHPSVARYLVRESETLKAGLILRLNGRPLSLETVSSGAIFPPGAGGLPTMKMGFLYRAVFRSPLGRSPSPLHYIDGNFAGRAGWKEVIAVAGAGGALVDSTVPSRDRSSELSNYPTDLLHSPPQILMADLAFKVVPQITPAGSGSIATSPIFLNAGSAARVNLAPNRQNTPRSAFTEFITSNRTDASFLLTAAFIALILGGFHALEPGHGKTLVAAYLVGSRGTARHAVLLGSVVTASHTISVYLLGIATLYASRWVVPERLYPWLATASGLLVALLGLTLFVKRLSSPDANFTGGHPHEHEHSHGDGTLAHRHSWWGGHVHDHASSEHEHIQGDAHSRGHDWSAHTHAHGRSYGHAHHHDGLSEPRHGERREAASGMSPGNLFVLGITGGIVPCPAALVVLLGALAVHRIAFGLFLIVAFSVGLAAVLVSLGLAMVYARQFMSRFQSEGPLTQRWLPLASSAVITVIGISITIQSLITAGVLRVGV